MASLVKRTTSPYWYARFQLNGKRHFVSTQETSKVKARKKLPTIVAKASETTSADKLFAELQDELARLPAKKQDEKRAQLARLLTAGLQSKLRIDDAWARWESTPKKRNPKAGTITHKIVGTDHVVTEEGWLPDGEVHIGLTAGASTPNNKIGDTVERIFATRGMDLEALMADSDAGRR